MRHTMPTNRLCQLFDRKLRQTKSTSNILQVTTAQGDVVSLLPSRPQSRESLSVAMEYNFNQSRRLSTHPPPAAPTARVIHAQRASTTPTIHPPDELFLSMVRRRSTSARLEHSAKNVQEPSYDDYYQKDSLPTPVALAYALPPQYFELPPAYESPTHMHQMWSPPPIRSRATIVKPRGTELFLEDDLHMQIDQAIAEFGGFNVVEATPVHTSTLEASDAPVSPINEIDTMYLERRRERHRQQQRSLTGI